MTKAAVLDDAAVEITGRCLGWKTPRIAGDGALPSKQRVAWKLPMED